MQDPSSFYSQMKSQVQNVPGPQFPDQEQLKCPRCDSTNTKFCYYNNYNLSQPRHYCKNCRRYWTKGGVLRNIPVGGGSRKGTKRSAGDYGEAGDPSAKRQASAAAVGSKSKSGGGCGEELGEAEASSSLGLKKGEGEANGAGHFGHLMDGNLGSLIGSSSGGYFGNYVDGLGCFAGHGPGQNMDAVILESGNSNNNGVEFLNADADGGGDESRSGNSNGWSGLAMYTPHSAFHH